MPSMAMSKNRKRSWVAALFIVSLVGAWQVSARDWQLGPRRAAGQTDERIQRGLAIAPVHLDLSETQPALVGLGSYLVNAVAGCNDCHTCPSYDPTDNPYVTGQGTVNADNYLAGGVVFGAHVVSRNLTPDERGRPAGMNLQQFVGAMRYGVNHHDPEKVLRVMPWPVFRNMTDSDLRAIYEYLRSIPHAEPGSCAGPGN